MYECYQNAMAIVREYGKPDFFVTFTCNPKWREIKEHLFSGQTATDRPDLCVRVFNLKLQELLNDLTSGMFGKVISFIYTIEYQKRGLPHAHILITLDFGIDLCLFPPIKILLINP
jgi:hypothetical protein